MNNIKYGYALDEHQNVISIHDVTQENRKEHTYHCIECGEELIPRLGTKRVLHFAHKCNTPNCTGETYLHKLAKRLIKEHFERSDSFMIKYFQNHKCFKHKTCPLYNIKCVSRNIEEFNLKEYYNTCQEEKQYENYTADILLTNSREPNKKPIFIEIHVKHKSTEEKINSGNRIIELTIKSEADIERFISSGIEESKYPEEEKEGYAQFYKFNTFSENTTKGWKCNLPKFFLYPSGKTFAQYINCYNAFEKKSDRNFEVCFYEKDGEGIELNTSIKYACTLAQKENSSLKFCPLCKYYSTEYPYICKCYKRFSTPKYPNAWDASECKYYRENSEEVRRIKSTIKEYDSFSGEIDGIRYKILT
ncbi:MAG: hypothetical protein J6L03_02955 [Bacteroidaceae bacterium]|nr:hypothetical protein [Bacteroidaceae bacterium]